MKIKNKIILPLLTILLMSTNCFAAWDATKPANNEKLKDTPALLRANWEAIALGTDSNLLITNAKVSASAAIVDTKLATISTAGKVSGAALTSLSSTPSGAGALPIANGGTGQITATAATNALLPSQTSNSGKALVTDATNTSWGYPAGLTIASQAQGDILYYNATPVLARLGAGTSGQFLQTQGTGANPVWSDISLSSLPTGTVLQVVNTQTGATASGTTTIPLDDTIPQNTEGTQFMTLAITPTSATTKLKIDVVFIFTPNASLNVVAALFQDSTASALACAAQSTTSGLMMTINFTYYMTSGTTSATTFKVRAGGDVAGTVYFNGNASGRRYGGVLASSMTITEIK